ncbi:hypothetical protein UlMin_020582 [Ulmus minor]
MSSSALNWSRFLEEKEDDKRRHDFPHHNNSYDLNSKIMLTAIISLSVVVLLVLLLHLYARYALRRQARRRVSIRQLGFTVAQTRSGEPPKTGLEPSVIASLPIFTFKSSVRDPETAPVECAVCLSSLEDEEMARLLPNCKHTFHAECIDRWLSSQSTCPICRTEAEPRLQPEPREGPVGGQPTAPPLEREDSGRLLSNCVEGTSSSAKVNNGSSSFRLSSFRRMLSRERSSRRIQSFHQEGNIVVEDLERQ